MKVIDIILLAIILAATFYGIYSTVKKKGGCSCGGNCSSCGGNCAGCSANCANRK